jgi:hypothetical protein
VIIVSPDKTRKDFLSKNPDQDGPRVPFYSIVIQGGDVYRMTNPGLFSGKGDPGDGASLDICGT